MRKRLIIGVSGASGAPLAIDVLNEMKTRADDWETHLIITDGAERTFYEECDLKADDVKKLADVSYDIKDLGAAVSSGSFPVEGMIVVPCSMKSLAGIASGYSDNLLLRAADVTLKQRRKLVLVARETPLSGIHLRNMLEVQKLGAVILPPVLTYYSRPRSVEDMTRCITGKILDEFGIEAANYKRWGM